MMLQTSMFEGGLKNLNISGAQIQDIIELKRDGKTAICSGKLTGTQTIKANPLVPNDRQVPFAGEFTWKVEETQDGKNFFTWVQGRQSASDME